MGYYTCYTLRVKDAGSCSFEELDAAIEKTNRDLEFASWKEDQYWFGSELAWDNHENDMVKLSKQFPEIIFVLSGAGDMPEDLWKKYFRNGLIQRAPANITYDEFDECKLRPPEEEEAEEEGGLS